MKSFLIWLILMLICINELQCNDNDRKQIVKELYSFKSSVINYNNNKISTFFSFPIYDKELSGLIAICKHKSEDDFVNKTERNDSGKVSKKEFLKNIKCVFDKDLLTLLNILNFKKLQISNHIDTTIDSKKNKHCQLTYSIDIKNDNIISLEILCNGKGENYNDECSEYAVTFYFIFDGKKLLFKNIFLAG